MINTNTKTLFKTPMDITVLVLAALYGWFVADIGGVWNQDDLTRGFGGFGWDSDGRPVANYLYNIISFRSEILDLTPLTEILSCVLIAFTGLLILKRFAPSYKDSYLNLAALIPVFSPLYLTNLLWSFDSLIFSFAFLLSYLGYAVISDKRVYPESLKFLLSTVILVLSLLTYEPAILIFLSCVIFDFFLTFSLTSKTVKEIFFKFLSYLGVIVLAVGVHHFLSFPDQNYFWARQTREFLTLSEMGSGIWTNLLHIFDSLVISNIAGLVFCPIKLIFFAGTAALVFLIISSKRSASIKLVLIHLIPIAIVVAVTGPFIFLKKPLLDSRYLLSFGILVLFASLLIYWVLNSLINKKIANKLYLVCIGLLLWSGVINIVQFHNAFKTQVEYQRAVSLSITHTLSKLMRENPNLSFASNGEFVRSRQLGRYGKENGFIKNYKLNAWGWKWYFVTNFNTPAKFHDDQLPSDAPVVEQTTDYTIYQKGDKAWVVLKG